MNARILLACIALCLPACGAPQSTSTPSATARHDAEWTASLLRKLDPRLRVTIRRGETAQVPVKVFFHETPDDETLSGLLLSRVGTQFIGRVQLPTLHEIASRPDVDRIESLNDVGY